MIRQWLDAMTCSVGVRINKARFASRFFAYLQSLGGIQENPVDASLICHMAGTQPALFDHTSLARAMNCNGPRGGKTFA